MSNNSPTKIDNKQQAANRRVNISQKYEHKSSSTRITEDIRQTHNNQRNPQLFIQDE